MKRLIIALFLCFGGTIRVTAGGDELTGGSNSYKDREIEKNFLAESHYSELLELHNQLVALNTQLKNETLTEADKQKDNTIINNFLSTCRKSLQDVTTQLNTLNKTSRNTLLNSPYSDIYKKGCADLDAVSLWAQKDPHLVATLISLPLQQEKN